MITQLNRQHDKALDRHMLQANVSNAIKQQLLEAVDDMFVSVLRHQRLRYSQVTPLQLMQHLVDNYDIVTEETLEDNRGCLGAEWNPDEGMEVLYTRITNVQQFAAEAGATHIISDATAMHLVLTALEHKLELIIKGCHRVMAVTRPVLCTPPRRVTPREMLMSDF